MSDEATSPVDGEALRDRTGESRPDGDYEVGYKKPPVHSRFKKGQSGNPRGRPSRFRNLASIFDGVLDEKVAIVENNGRRRQISKREAIVRQYLNGSLKGDPRAAQMIIRLLSRGGEMELAAPPFTVVLVGNSAKL